MASTGQEQATSLPLHWGQYENNPHQSQFLLSTLSSNLLSDMPPWEKLVPQKKNRSKETSLITMKGFSSFEFLKPQSHLFLAFKRILDWSKQLKGNLFAFSTKSLFGTRHIIGTVCITRPANNVSPASVTKADPRGHMRLISTSYC